jgi:hypothetical protein
MAHSVRFWMGTAHTPKKITIILVADNDDKIYINPIIIIIKLDYIHTKLV